LDYPVLGSLVSWQGDEGWRAQTLSDTELPSFKVSRFPPVTRLSLLLGFRHAGLQLSSGADQELGTWKP